MKKLYEVHANSFAHVYVVADNFEEAARKVRDELQSSETETRVTEVKLLAEEGKKGLSGLIL